MRKSFDRVPRQGSDSTHICIELAGRAERAIGGAERRAVNTALSAARLTLIGALLLFAGSAVFTSSASASVPEPCNGVIQINDASGDGHHMTTDVLAAWFSESAGSLQAVIRVKAGNWAPDHEDSDNAGFVLLFGVGAGPANHYVRVVTPRPADGDPVYDYGTWNLAGGFASAGATTGSLVGGTNGTATIEIPSGALGLVGGSVITAPFVLTYDGEDSPSQPHWVDRAPGGTSPSTTEVGADYVVGCDSGSGEVTAVELHAPASRKGSGPAALSGSVVPALEGVEVELTIETAKGTTQRQVTTASDGTFADQVQLGETARIHAVAGVLSSQTKTVTMRSRVDLRVRAKRNGRVAISGSVDPRLKGKVLILGTGDFKPSAKTKVANGQRRFVMSLKRLAKGRYQAVYVPSGGRAERSVSKAVSHKNKNKHWK